MPGILRCQGSKLVLLLGIWAAVAGCEPFDTTRVPEQRGTLGEEIYKIACERIASEVYPSDVSGTQSRALCRGQADASTAPAGRLRALAENRDRLVEALDRTLPADLEDELQNLLVEMLPFYDPPTELLPNNTRAIGALLADLMADPDVMQAFGRISQRRGMRVPRNALGLVRPVLAYPGLADLSATALATVDDGGPLEPEWSAVMEAGALEMATAAPTDPSDPTLGLVRDLMLRSDDTFGSTTPRYVVARDSRGLPVPATLDGSQGFVDIDVDGLADVDSLGRFVTSDGTTPVNPPTPFPVVDETGVTRDAYGRALTAAMDPLYVYQDVERSVLAGLLREAPQLLDPTDSILIDLAYGMLPLLGADAPGQETYGALTLDYDGFSTSDAPIYDLTQAGAELLAEDETRDVLTLAQMLLADHEADIVPLVQSGFFGDALGDATTGADLAPGSELWDDVLQAVTWMSEVPGMTEAVLRSFTDPRSRHLGQIYAELIRFRDQPNLDGADPNAVLEEQYWNVAVNHAQADSGANQSLFQQTLSIIWELNGAQTCNKQDADLYALGLNLDWLVGGPFDRCAVVNIANTTELFIQSILGTAWIEVNLNITALLDWLNIPGLTLDDIMESESGITGFTRSPTPQALARFVYGPWTDWLTSLMERTMTIDGERADTRYTGHPILAWERVFHFCGDKLLDQGETCATTVENVSFYDAMTPMLQVFDTMDPRTGGRYLFAELVGAIHEHYPSAANNMYQGTTPTDPHFAHPDGAVTYEPIVSELLADCAWTPSGGGRTCDPSNAGRLISRLAHASEVLDSVEIRPGVDGIDVLAAAAERMVNPALNPGLLNRAGSTTTKTNSNTRTVPNTPIYLLLDALNHMDAAHDTDAARNASWLDARSRLIDTLLTPEPLGNDQFQFTDRRVPALARIVLGFTGELIDSHVSDGDLVPWSRALDDDLADVLGGAMGSRTMRFLDALNGQPATQQAFLELVQYLLDESSPNDAFENLLLSSADLLFLLDDDDTLVTLLNSVSDTLALNAGAAVAGGGTVEVEGAIADQVVSLLNQTSQVDTAKTMPTVLANSVQIPTGELQTPLEVILDVVAEVNRATPNEGGPLEPDDHAAVMQQVVDFLGDEDHGLERLYDVVQNRELAQ